MFLRTQYKFDEFFATLKIKTEKEHIYKCKTNKKSLSVVISSELEVGICFKRIKQLKD